MPDYTNHSVWHVQADGEVWVEADSLDQAKARGKDLLIAGEGKLILTAELHEAFIEAAA